MPRSKFIQEELDYYSRQLVMVDFGLEGQSKLKKASVLIAGIGGLGSQISAQLSSMGIGHLKVADKDIVEVSNLQRQHLYSMDVINIPKVEAAKLRLSRMNPFIEIEAVPTSINSYTASKLVRGIDVVVDGLDTLKPRLALNRACIDANVPYIFGSAITNVGSVSTIIPNETACLECWHIGIDESKIPTCATVGVTPSIISLIASIEVSEVIRILIGKKANLAGKLLFCDLNDITFEKLDLVRSDECPSCGKIVSRIKPEIIEEICGRNGKRVFIVTPNRELTLDPFIKINKLNDLGFTPIYTSSYGVTFCSVEENKKAIKGSIFNTGVFVIEGLDSKELVLDIYKNITGIKLNTD